MLNYHMKRSLICDDERMKKNCTIHIQICIRKKTTKTGQNRSDITLKEIRSKWHLNINFMKPENINNQ
jgi:hypothetical protein